MSERQARWGRNELAEPETRSRWLVYLDQFRNVLVALLIVAAVVAGAIGDVKDSIAIAVVLVFNATLGYVQEQKAARNLAALREMLALSTRVRRDGAVSEIPHERAGARRRRPGRGRGPRPGRRSGRGGVGGGGR